MNEAVDEARIALPPMEPGTMLTEDVNPLFARHPLPDIENNLYEGMKHQLAVVKRRIDTLENTFDKTRREKYWEDLLGTISGACAWIVLINVCIKVFN